MKITVAQTLPVFLKPTHNLKKIELVLKSSKSDLVIFPELCTSGYNFSHKKQLARVAERIPTGPTRRCLQKWSREKNMAIVCGLPEQNGGKFYNSSIFVTPRSIHVYRKRHLFFKEKKFFNPGNTPLKVYPWKNAHIGVMICFDWFFPEVMRTLAEKGADLVAHPSNLVLPYALQGMKTRSLENGVFSATANRVGRERNLVFRGGSQILGVRGEVLAEIKNKKVGTITTIIQPRTARNKMLTPLNNIFKDRSLAGRL